MKLTKVEDQQKAYDEIEKFRYQLLVEWWNDLPPGTYKSEDKDIVEVEGIRDDKQIYLNDQMAFEYVHGFFYNINWEVAQKLIS